MESDPTPSAGTRPVVAAAAPTVVAGLRRPRVSAADELTQDLIDVLKQQGLEPGDRLPAVSTLAQQFGVATPTIREALRRLQALGLLHFRHGSGVYVRAELQRVIVSNPYSGQLDTDVLLDLIDARLLIEPHLACLAVVRGGRQAVGELEGILDQADQSLEGQDETLSNLNLDFHRAIARLSGNTVLGQTMDSLLDLYAAEQMMILQVYDNRERDAREHRAVLTAIRGGRPDLAAEQMREHLTGVRTVVEQRLIGSDASRSPARD